MAAFDISYKVIQANEGGYVNNPADPGGETYAGVSRHFHPSWAGWETVDRVKASLGPGAKNSLITQQLNAIPSLQDLVKLFYLKEFWQFDAISSQDVADKLMDVSVNLDPKRAVKVLQSALRYVLNKPELAVDGIMGPSTLALTNAADPAKLLLELRAQIVMHYCEHAKDVFKMGLMRRGVK